jgi:hypothetical protein
MMGVLDQETNLINFNWDFSKLEDINSRPDIIYIISILNIVL